MSTICHGPIPLVLLVRTALLRSLTNYMFVVLFYLVKVLVFLCLDLLGVACSLSRPAGSAEERSKSSL